VKEDQLKMLQLPPASTNSNTQIWNSLLDSVIDVTIISTLKNKLDKLLANESVKFNWRSALTG